MKKIVLLVFAMILTLSISAQEKKSFEGAIEHAGLTEKEKQEVMVIQKEKQSAIKAIKKEGLEKAEEKEKIAEVRKESGTKMRAIVGKEKYRAMNAYWKKD